MVKKHKNTSNLAIDNRKARHEYEILEEYEAGICLVGTEVKSLRTGKGNLQDSYADVVSDKQGRLEIFLLNCYIPEYGKASMQANHKSRRQRKLLLHKQEIKKLFGKTQKKGLTIIPLNIHWNEKGIAKVKLGLCRGKSSYDKRQSEKDKDWNRQKQRALREG